MSVRWTDYLADTVEDVFFETMKRQSAPVSKSNWSLLEAGFSRAFVFHMAVVTGAPTIAVLVVLVYLDRMRSRLVVPPACLVHGLVPERLLLGAWILAFQVRVHVVYMKFALTLTWLQSLYGVPVNRFQIWADATKLFSPAEVEQTIAEIKNVLGGDLSFTEADMRAHCIKLVCFYETWSDTLAQTGFVRDELAMGGLAADGLAQDGRVHAGGVQDGFMHEGHVQHGGVQGNFMQDGSQQDERVQDPQYRFGSVAHGSISDENQ